MRSSTTPLTIPTDLGRIEIQAEEGCIHLDASDLRETCGMDFLERLLEQAVISNVIESICIDRTHGTATITYESTRWSVPEALSCIGGMLDGERVSTSDRSEVSLNLSSVPGIVTRVDRVRTVAVPGTSDANRFRNWMTRLLPFGRRIASRAARETNAVMQGVIIHYEPVAPLLADAELAGADTLAEDAGTSTDEAAQPLGIATRFPAEPATGWRRAANLAAAGGCFALSIIGFITPGIPALPFVLATSHFLVRSTPALNERLRESRLFGAIVRDWEDQGGMRQSTKVRTLVVMFSLLGATALLSGGSLPVLIMTSAVGGIDLLVVMAIPTITEERDLPENQPLLEYQPLVA